MTPTWIVCILFLIPVAVAIGAYRILNKKIVEIKNRPIKIKELEVEKISLPGFEVKVINGELSLTPKK